MTHFTPWSVECVKRVSNPSGLLSILFPIVAGAGGIYAYLTNQLAAHSEAKHGPRILNPRQERTFIRIASAAKGESVHIKTFGDNPKAEQFLRQVERLIFDSGIMISRSVMLEPQTPIANQYTITIELPNLSSPPDVATVLSRAFNVIGIHTPIVAKSDRDYDKDVTVRIYVTM